MDTLFWNTNLRSDNHMRAPFLPPPANHNHNHASSSSSNSKPSFVTAIDDDVHDSDMKHHGSNGNDAGVTGRGKKGGAKGTMVDAMGGDVQGISGGPSAQPAATPTKSKPLATTAGVGKGGGTGARGELILGSGVGPEQGGTSSSAPVTLVPPAPPALPPPALTEVAQALVLMLSLALLSS